MTSGDTPTQTSEQEAWQIQMARSALLSEVVLLIARTPDLNRLLTQAINKLKWVIDFERCTLALLNEDGQSYRLQTLLETRPHIPPVKEESVPLDRGLIAEVIRRKQVRLLTNLALTEIPLLDDPALTDGSLASSLSLPLQAYGKVLGAITFSTVKSEGYSDGDIKVATSFATHLALAIERWQQTQRLQQANEELARLASFPELNPNPIIEVDTSCTLHYLNPMAQQLFPDLQTSNSQHPLLVDLPEIVIAFTETKTNFLTDEIKIGKVWYQRALHLVMSNRQSAGDVTSKVGVSRIRIYVSDITERKQAEEALQQQNAYLAALHDTSLGLISRLDLNELLSTLITRAGQLLGTEHGYIYLVTPEGTEIERKVGLGVFSQFLGMRLKAGEGVAGKIWQSGQPLVVADYDVWPDRSSHFDDQLIRAVIGVPLRSGAQVVGVIGLARGLEAKQPFGDEEVELLSRFAQLAAIALDNAQLFEAVQSARAEAEEEAQRLALINEMSRQMSLAQTEQAIFDITAHFTLQIVACERSSIALIMPDGDQVGIIALNGVAGAADIGVSFPWRESDLAGAITEKRLTYHRHRADPSLPHILSGLNAPLVASGQVIGTLNVGRGEPNAFTQRDQTLLGQIASLVAANVESRRLFAQIQQALAGTEELAQRLARLNEMGQRMSLATSEAEIYKVTTHYTSQIIPADRVSVALLAEDGVYLQIFALRGREGAIPAGKHVALSDTSAGQAIQERRVIYSTDFQETPTATEQQLSQQGLRSGLNAPMIVGERVLGTLNVASLNRNAYSQRDENLLLQIAAFLGATIENHRLIQEIQQTNQELSQTLDNLRATQNQLVEAEKMAALGGLVAGVAHEINTPVGVGVTAASLLEEKTATFRQTYQSGQMKRSDLEKYLDLAGQSSQMILNNLSRAAELIQSFKQVAVDQSSEERRVFLVKAYLEEILLSLHPKLKRTPLTIEIYGEDALSLNSYPGAFAQIVTNLVMNSLIHAYEPDDKGQLTFEFKQQNGRFIFEYSDDGQGIPSENLAKIFEPFFTTRRGQGGSGLGLHIIYNLVTQKLGGQIRCESEVGKGTRFIIEVPGQSTIENSGQ